jgi:hypothetical protein
VREQRARRARAKKSGNEGRTHDLIENKGSAFGTHDVYENTSVIVELPLSILK